MSSSNHRIIFAGAGPGDPELITLRARAALDAADVVVYAGSLVNPVLLDGLDAEIHDSSGMDLENIMDIMISAHRQGKRVVRLHTGDPAIYGATGEQMRRLDKEGIGYEVIPGVTSATAAAAAVRAELTLPGVSQTVILTRMSGRTPVPDREALASLASHQASLCIYLSVSMLKDVVHELLEGGYGPDTPAVVVEKATWPDERIVSGTLDTIADAVRRLDIRKTAMILVGHALEKGAGEASCLYDPAFSHGYRQATG
jgi:precorrin-4/cobalt-precorrin-4 C11-methyltransferase